MTNKKVKCLILCMGCNDQLYWQLWEDAKNTWAKDIIEGKYPDIDIIMYTSSGNDEYFYNLDDHVLYVPCNDSITGTFEKTVKALEALNMFGKDYESVLKINCETIINIKLLNAFIHSNIYDKNKVYTGQLFLANTLGAPYETSILFDGNFILMNKHYANLINFTSVEMAKLVIDRNRIIHKNLFFVDDVTICAILNTYFLGNNIDPYDIYLPLPTLNLLELYWDKKEPLYGNVMAIFTKHKMEVEKITEHYEDFKPFVDDFYSKYYNLLTDNIDNLRSDMDVLRNVEIMLELESEPNTFKGRVYSFDEIKNMKIKKLSDNPELQNTIKRE